MARFHERMIRAARLDVDTYEEVEADKSATGQATVVVVLSAAAAGIGGVDNHGVGGIVWHTLAQLAGWYVWAYVTYFIGTRFLPTADTVADHGELLRTIGFSSAPGILRAFALFDPLALPLFVGCGLWMLVTMVVAVRQALDYTGTGRAIAVCAIPFPIYLVIQLVSLVLLGSWPV